MPTAAAVVKDGTPIQGGALNTIYTNLTAQFDGGSQLAMAGRVWVYNPLSQAEGAVDANTVFAQGAPNDPGSQNQFEGADGGVIDLSSYTQVLEPAGAAAWVGDVGDTSEGAFPFGTTVAHFASAIVAPPGVGDAIDVPMLDATLFAGLSDGAEIFYAGLIYTLVAAASVFDTRANGGSLHLTNTGVAAIRMCWLG